MTKSRRKVAEGEIKRSPAWREEEKGGEGGFMVAVMQKCKHFATFAENNDTAGRGRCASVFLLLCVCGGGCNNSTTGSGRRTTELK